MKKTIDLQVVCVDAETQVRVRIDEKIVAEYAAQMQASAPFPPIVVFHDGTQYYIGDGFHRTLAATRNQALTIVADVRPGTRDDALWFALGANRTNGLRLTPADKKHAILLALKTWPERSQTDMAAQIGCTQGLISQVISTNNLGSSRPASVKGKDGKRYPASRPARVDSEEPETRQRAVATVTHPKYDAIVQMVKTGVSGRAIQHALKVHPSTISAIRRALGLGGLDKSGAAVKERRERMRTMAAEGHSSRQIAAALGLSDEGCRVTLRREAIAVPADRVTANTKQPNSNRILEHIVLDAENLTADVNLIDYKTLDQERLGDWIDLLTVSRNALNTFIRRLTQEHKHEAA